MNLNFNTIKLLVSLIIVAWIGVFSFCGFGAFIPALLGVSHHASDSTVTQCEKVCLAKAIASHDATIGILVEIPPQSELKSTIIATNAFHDALDRLPVSDPVFFHTSSAKRYQFLSTYRL